MTMNGASGTTFEAMRNTLRFGALSEEEINASYRSLLELLTELDPQVEIAVGNSVWHRAALTLREDFRERVEEYFGARVEGLNFGAPGAAETINGWVSQATRNRIEEIVTPPIPGNVIAYLINAVYFKGGWTVPFNPELTRAGDFHLLDGTTERAEFMMRDDTVRYFQTDRYAAVDLPYAGQAFSATIVAPPKDIQSRTWLTNWTLLSGERSRKGSGLAGFRSPSRASRWSGSRS
jgi:serpin B